MREEYLQILRNQKACAEAILWAFEQNNTETAWNVCERGDWMIWLWSRNVGKKGSESHSSLKCAVAHVETYLNNVTASKLDVDSETRQKRCAEIIRLVQPEFPGFR